MGLVLSLQGGMACGKTTAGRCAASRASWLSFFPEDNREAARLVREHGWDKRRFEDYIQIQRVYISRELERIGKARSLPCALLDYGPEELLFYTLHYPAAIGESWPVEEALEPELSGLRRNMPDYILFLQASPEVLQARREADGSRDRGFFDFSTEKLLPAKEKWLASMPNVSFLPTDRLSPEETGQAVLEWAESHYITGGNKL